MRTNHQQGRSNQPTPHLALSIGSFLLRVILAAYAERCIGRDGCQRTIYARCYSSILKLLTRKGSAHEKAFNERGVEKNRDVRP